MKKLKDRAYGEKLLLESIDNVISEIDNSRRLFENTNDPKLIDYAIYMEEALKSKYVYLLKQAKEKGIKVEYCENIKEVQVG
ncbi:YaaL family protein [Clostridium sp. Marseille-Q2269]|uniref:YaaL family protein n=1 Tax=Clostridium sp. Marseille-Q2269 TaxID=2942205 RepID=UPI0020735F4B|nr:YaaL family protein [Clostridium sp. Marseille-Q2269]